MRNKLILIVIYLVIVIYIFLFYHYKPHIHLLNHKITDKDIHFMFYLLSFIFLFYIIKNQFINILILLTVNISIEFIQPYFHRTYDIRDIAYGMLGLFYGIVIYNLFKLFFKRIKPIFPCLYICSLVLICNH